MISIDVKPYCENCPEFCPEMMTKADVVSRTVNHSVYCQNQSICEHIHEYLKNVEYIDIKLETCDSKSCMTCEHDKKGLMEYGERCYECLTSPVPYLNYENAADDLK